MLVPMNLGERTISFGWADPIGQIGIPIETAKKKV
jgi:hypothetical protein